MVTIGQDDFAARLDGYLAKAAQLDSPVLIERGGEEHDVVIVSDRDYRGMLTTIELLSNRAMAADLRASLEELERDRRPEAHAAE